MKKIIIAIFAAVIIIIGCTKNEENIAKTEKSKSDITDTTLRKAVDKPKEDSLINYKLKEAKFNEKLTPEDKLSNVTFKTYTPLSDVEPRNIVYVIDYDGKSITDTARSYTDIEIKFIDIDKSDGYKELLLKINPGSEETGLGNVFEYRVYKFTDKPLLITGKYLYSIHFTPDGKGKVSATSSESFTALNETYVYSKDGMKLEEVPVDYYTINVSATAKVPINLVIKRDENSGSATTIEQGEKVKLTGFDKKEIRDGKRCNNWFKVSRPNGKSGWLLIECCNFEEFFEGIHCAG
ncbi:MAG: hypothetical protein WC139_00105 [Candidatus Kapaibacterium sp.]